MHKRIARSSVPWPIPAAMSFELEPLEISESMFARDDEHVIPWTFLERGRCDLAITVIVQLRQRFTSKLLFALLAILDAFGGRGPQVRDFAAGSEIFAKLKYRGAR